MPRSSDAEAALMHALRKRFGFLFARFSGDEGYSHHEARILARNIVREEMEQMIDTVFRETSVRKQSFSH